MSPIAVMPIRYDGADADAHVLELAALGESMQGVSRVLSTVAHFVVTGEYVKQQPSMGVRVLAQPPRDNCFTFVGVIEFVRQHQMLQGLAPGIIAAVITWIVARASNNTAEMKLLHQSLNEAIRQMAGGNAAIVERLSATIERMADGLRPALRQSVAPIGTTCSTMRFGDAVTINEATAAAIRQESIDSVSDEADYVVLITELDLENRTAKVRIEGLDDTRVPASITDPALALPGSAYLAGFTTQTPLAVRGKTALRDGEIARLYISNTR